MIGNDWTILVDRWMHHPQYGLAALLDQVPLRPGMSRIGEVTIRNDVEDKDCVSEYRPTGGSGQYLVIGTEPADPPTKTAPKGRNAEKEDHVGLGLFYLVEFADRRRALANAEIVLEAAAASLRLLGDKGFCDKIDPPADRPTWQEYGNIRVVECVEMAASRLKGTAQSNHAVAIAGLFARLKGLRFTFQPPGVP